MPPRKLSKNINLVHSSQLAGYFWEIRTENTAQVSVNEIRYMTVTGECSPDNGQNEQQEQSQQDRTSLMPRQADHHACEQHSHTQQSATNSYSTRQKPFLVFSYSSSTNNFNAYFNPRAQISIILVAILLLVHDNITSSKNMKTN